MEATVIGAGLAGSEAAWQLANNGINVRLYEMRPGKMTPAHHTGDPAELVCSNSFRAGGLTNAVGLLKEEMRCLGSLIMEAADACSVPAGGALAVDREAFSKYVLDKLTSHPGITIVREEIKDIPTDRPVIVATGPLSSDSITESIGKLINDDYLYFFDAAAPIITYESLDKDKVFKASRYGKGDDDYINCPMDKDEYLRFYNELINAEGVQLKEFENSKVFEGCMPIEVMAKRGEDTMRFGPLKPVGLVDPRTGKEPYAAVQLRQDNAAGTLYNIVGFQTHLKFGEQKRVFSMIPGLENAEFVRYGVMHRNTFIQSPKLLDKYYRLRSNSSIFFAGQITGVEGYLESASSGLVAGLCLSQILKGLEPVDFTDITAIGALANYISNPANTNFQPMNINFGIVRSPEKRIRNKKEKNTAISQRALEYLKQLGYHI